MKHNSARDQSSWLLSSINTTAGLSLLHMSIHVLTSWYWADSIGCGRYLHFLWKSVSIFSVIIHLSGTRTRFRFRQDGQLLRIGEILPIPDREMMKYNLNKLPGTHRNCPPCEKPMALYPDCSLESLASWSQTLSICLLTFIRNPFSVS